MAQLPNVKLKIHPSTFDLMMAVLEDNAASAADERDRMNARDLMEKRMRFSRLYPGKDGQEYASVQMYERSRRNDLATFDCLWRDAPAEKGIQQRTETRRWARWWIRPCVNT